MHAVSARAFKSLVKKWNQQDVDVVWFKENWNNLAQSEVVNAITEEDIREHQQKQAKPETDASTVLPNRFHDLIDVFSKKASDQLAQHRDIDHKIELTEAAADIGYPPLRRMSDQELQEVKKYLDENLAKGFIVPSSASIASPVLFVRKPSGGLRFCVDYRKLNDKTKKNRYPIPLIDETLGRLQGAKFFTKIDIRQAFHRLRMNPDSKEMTTFRTRFGAFMFEVMPFGLTNGPASWQRLINEVLFEYLDEFCSAYLDDILIYSKTREEHHEHVRKVLLKLQEHGLQADIDKCEFYVQRTKFLGLIVTTDGIEMDPEKIRSILEWQPPRSLKGVQAYLGVTNYYRRFIADFSSIARPLTKLTRKDTPFRWDDSCQESFEELKRRLVTAPILAHFDPKKKTYVNADSSDFVMGGVLHQEHDGVLKPVAFFSKNLLPAECNYEIYDKELLAVITAFEQWEPELQTTHDPVTVFTDHKALEYFMRTKKLSRRQVRWAEFLSRFDFAISHTPGRQNVVADALSRRTQDLPKEESDPRLTQQFQQVLKPRMVSQEVRQELQVYPVEEQLPVLSEVVETANRADVEEMNKLRSLANNGVPGYELRKGLLLFDGKVYVPEHLETQTKLIEQVHRQPSTGHPGRQRLLGLLRPRFFFPKMAAKVAQYVKNCSECYKSANRQSLTLGLLRPLPVPDAPWQDISVDFVGPMPVSNGHRFVMVVVDRLTKMHHYVPCKDEPKGTSAETMAQLFLDWIYRLHGLPRTIVSDQGPQFTSRFWEALTKLLRVQLKLSSPYHPQTDGQTERANQDLEQYLRKFVNWKQDDWSKWLSLAEFCSNAMRTEATGMSPFYANYGYEPRFDFDANFPQNADGSAAEQVAANKAVDVARAMRQIWDQAKESIELRNARSTRAANATRTEHELHKGDLVLLSSKHLATTRPLPSWTGSGKDPTALDLYTGTRLPSTCPRAQES